jgi:hypothetical protein
VFNSNITEIYKANKQSHLKAIAKKSGADLKDIIFFDNEYGNCQTVAKIGKVSSFNGLAVSSKRVSKLTIVL